MAKHFSLVRGQHRTTLKLGQYRSTLKDRTAIGFEAQGIGLVPAQKAEMNSATTQLRFKYEIPSTKS